ncbi:MAG TPA: putative glycoside hydrolase [Vicinamibacterales bacterium]|nr:putative glycoside hydrolase [Vicinamibacterales bacterium]
MTRRLIVAFAVLALTAFGRGEPRAVDVAGRVVDAATHAPIRDAIVTSDGREIRTDAQGSFQITAPADRAIGVRAYGYGRVDRAAASLSGSHGDVALTPIRPKALYLSMFGIASSSLRTPVLRLAETMEINALVIDVKGDRGLIAFPRSDPVAHAVGAQKTITIKDLHGLAADLHERGLYLIARIVVFKDDLLATGRPDLAVHRLNGSLFRDREGLAWTNPYDQAVWDYNIGVAVDAARAGFDEIQFDYVRLPDAQDLALPLQRSEANRVAPIDGFLTKAREALRPFNVFLAADVFGYVCWNTNDTGIGQRLGDLMSVVDYLSPMVYPSAYQFGIPGCRNPATHPYDVVRRSLEEAVRRTGVPPVRIRPWLQAFPDYAFRSGSFTHGEVRSQIGAAEDVGTDGWMLWNPRNRYSAADLRPGT